MRQTKDLRRPIISLSNKPCDFGPNSLHSHLAGKKCFYVAVVLVVYYVGWGRKPALLIDEGEIKLETYIFCT